MPDRVVIDPRIHHGQPVIRGTRVPIVRIIGGLAGSMTFEKIQQEYGVTEEDIRAALAFADGLSIRSGSSSPTRKSSMSCIRLW